MCKKNLYRHCYIILCLLLLTAFAVFCFISIYNNYTNFGAWSATKDVFALLGILLAIGGSIPVISGVFSYQQFRKSVKEANKELLSVKQQMKKLSRQIENNELRIRDSLDKLKSQEFILEEYIAFAKDNKVIKEFVFDEGLVDDKLNVEVSLNKINSITLYQSIASDKLDEYYLFQQIYRYGDNELELYQLDRFVEIRTNLVKKYLELSRIDKVFTRNYIELLCGTINYIAKQNIGEKDVNLLDKIKCFKEMFENIDRNKKMSFNEIAQIHQANENLKKWFS